MHIDIAKKYGLETPSKLLDAATSQSEKSPAEYQQCTRLYYIARFMVGLFEGRSFLVPGQVWNEYRNALDHFMRYISGDQNNTSNLEKMEGHLQRAVLDVCKLFTIYMLEQHQEKVKGIDISVLKGVDNGNLHTYLIQKEEEITQCFIHAKTVDSSLGKHYATNLEVLNLFLTPCYQLLELNSEFIDKQQAIQDVEQQHIGIRNQAAIETVDIERGRWWDVRSGLAANIVYGIIVFGLGILANKYLPIFNSPPL